MKPIIYIFLCSFLGVAQFSTPAADSKKAASLKAATQAKRITLVTKDNKKVFLPNAFHDRFGLIKTAIETEQEEIVEVPLPSVTGEILEIILASLYDKEDHRVRTFDEIKNELSSLVTAKNINEIYKTADYLAIDKKDPLFEALAAQYASGIIKRLGDSEKSPEDTISEIIKDVENIPNARFYVQGILDEIRRRQLKTVLPLYLLDEVAPRKDIQQIIRGYLIADKEIPMEKLEEMIKKK